jgi:predicted Zn finger-like uncharacterized protein
VTVRCPACGTLYRRPARAARGAPTFRCARCGHVFDVVRDEPEAPPEAGEVAVDESGEGFVDGDDDAERFAFDDTNDDEPEDERPPAEKRRASRVELEADAAAEADAEPEAQAAPRRQSTPARFAVRMLFIVTLGYAILSAYLYTHVDTAYRLLADVPVIGSRLVERRLSPGVVQIAGLRGEYVRVKGDELVFAVAGTAVNGGTIPVRGLRIEGWVTGSAEVRHTVTVGARPRQIADLSLREIGLLQALEPPSTWSLGPGETIPFLIVFPEPTDDLKEFGARVVNVRAARS